MAHNSQLGHGVYIEVEGRRNTGFWPGPRPPIRYPLILQGYSAGTRNAERNDGGRISASCGLKFDVNSLGIEFDTFAMSGSVVSCE